MQLNPSPLAVTGLGVVVVVILLFGWYWFFEKPKQELLQRRKQRDMVAEEFVNVMKLVNFGERDERQAKEILAPILLVFMVTIISPYLLSTVPILIPVVILMSLLGCFSYWNVLHNRSKDREVALATSAPSAFIYCYFPELGFRFIFVRAFAKQKEVMLDSAQRDVLAETAVEVLQNMEQFKRMPFNDEAAKKAFLDEAKKQIREKLNGARPYHFLAEEKFPIVLITQNALNDMETPERITEVFRTFDVNMKIMPFWGIYCDNTDRVFKSMSGKGETIWNYRRAGIILDVFDLADFIKILTEGKFTVPDKMTALVGSMATAYEQNQTTAPALNQANEQRQQAIEDAATGRQISMLPKLEKLQEKLAETFAKVTGNVAKEFELWQVGLIVIAIIMTAVLAFYAGMGAGFTSAYGQLYGVP